MHPAAGSHANFFGDGAYLGAPASQGVGCDDTRGADLEVRPVVQTIPSDPAAARDAFPWIGFEGRWGELQPAFFNGPTGPNLKTQWTQPIQLVGGLARPQLSRCPAAARWARARPTSSAARSRPGSNALRQRGQQSAADVRRATAALDAVTYGLSRASWRPTAPLRLAHRRAWGQILTASARMYASHLRLFLAIGCCCYRSRW